MVTNRLFERSEKEGLTMSWMNEVNQDNGY